MNRLFARFYTQTNYQTNYRSLPKFVPDGWSVSSINRANVLVVISKFFAKFFHRHKFEDHTTIDGENSAY